ncbi:hypothetical protein [Actinopolymorpha alba]|uniref:hypothetical protein n=1 Tax=Actinopolymorpha alba TaxID=533267 RepID=UPI0003799CE9|nr:hypothetical protein [Actinopolymorpha alba]
MVESYDAARIRTPHKVDRLLIEPSLRPGRFDSLMVDCPAVYSDQGEFLMTYVGWDGVGYQTALSRSRDLLHWEQGELILRRDERHPYRRYNAALTSIVRDNRLHSAGQVIWIDGRAVGTYHAYPEPGMETGPAIIGFCTSANLTAWRDIGSILRPEDGGAWERGGLYKSWLLRHDGLYYCFYNAKDRTEGPWREQTGYAVSADLMRWRRPRETPVIPHGGPGDFDERFASDPCVLRDGSFWVMFYFGFSFDGHARESYATSRDLHTWAKSGEILVDVGPVGSVDSTYAHKPAIISHDGRLHHFYTAVSKQETIDVDGYPLKERRGISVAHSDAAGGLA